MKSEHYTKRFQEVAVLLCDNHLPAQLVEEWFNPDFDEAGYNLQDWCANNIKLPWMTGFGTIDAIATIIEAAIENGNLSQDCSTEFPVVTQWRGL